MLDTLFGISGTASHYECKTVPRHPFERCRHININKRFGDMGIGAGTILSARFRLHGGGSAHNSKISI